MKKTRKSDSGTHEYIIWFIRLTLSISIILNLAFVISQLYPFNQLSNPEILNTLGKKLELIFFSVLVLILSFVPDYIEKRENIHLPNILELVVVLFIYASLFLSHRFGLYYRFFWWDDFLHTLSGVIIGFIGFIAIYKINGKFRMNISPLMVAFFSFSFSVTLGVFWEILEFLLDVFLGTKNQKWGLPDNARLIGKSYQGSGLRDTMSDLIVDSIGALITSIICYFLYKDQRIKILRIMTAIFPEHRKK